MSWLNSVRGIFLGGDFSLSGRLWITVVLVVLLIGVVLTSVFWDRLNAGSEIRTETLESGVTTVSTKTVESAGTTLRNVGLIIGGIVAVILAMWRSLVAERQAYAALQQTEATFLQAETAERQSTTALRSFLNERYEQGARNLGSYDPTVRLDGIDVLERLGREHPPEYHVAVMKRLSLFVRPSDSPPRLPAEVAAAMSAIGSRSGDDINLENNETFELNLVGADLQDQQLSRLNLSGANLVFVNLSGALLLNVDLSNAHLQGAKLKDAWLLQANLSGTEFSIGEGDHPVEGLTQAQLNIACAYGDNPPTLDGVLDADSGEQLMPPPSEPGLWETITQRLNVLEQGQP